MDCVNRFHVEVERQHTAGMGSNRFDVYVFGVEFSYQAVTGGAQVVANLWLPSSGVSSDRIWARSRGVADTYQGAVADALREWGAMMSLAVRTAADKLDAGQLQIEGD